MSQLSLINTFVSQITKQPVEENQTNLAPLEIIRTETVLSRLPIHNLAKKGRIDIRILRNNDQGEANLKWEVSYSERYGQARQLAYKLDTLVVNQRIDEEGRPLPKVVRLGSLREICRDLGIPTGGSHLNAVKTAMFQNAFTGITAKLTYKGTDGAERNLEAGFTRYSVIFRGEKLPSGAKADAVYLILNEPYWEVLNNAPARPLDYSYLKALPPAAQRFYELVSFRIFSALKYRHPQAKMLYSEYCTFSAQQRYADYDHFKKQMYKVHKPHLRSGYLKEINYEAALDGEGKPDWTMYYTPGPKAEAEYKAFSRKRLIQGDLTEEGRGEGRGNGQSLRDPLTTQAEELVARFYKLFHGTEGAVPQPKELDQARRLIVQHGFEKALHFVDFSHRVAPETNYNPQTFGGIISYTSRALADYTSQLKAQEQKKKKEAEEQELKRREQEARQRDDQLLVNLSSEERDRLFQEARDELLVSDPFVNKNPDGLMAQALIKDAVLKKLKGQTV